MNNKHLPVDGFYINDSNGPTDLPIAWRIIVIAVIVLLSGAALQGLYWLFEKAGL